VRLREDESATVRDYTVTYLGSDVDRSDQKTTVSTRIRVERGSDDLGVYAPAISTFPNSTQGIGTPSVRTGLREDVYLTLVSSPNQRGRITLGVAVNPMVLWLWIGGAVMALGTLLALAPSLRRTPGQFRRRSTTHDVAQRRQNDEVEAPVPTEPEQREPEPREPEPV
jgi:cytochrome c-type biogenesis protein CcmF